VDSFEGRIAVVTGGGTGMGRALVAQLAADGCHVAACDVSPEALAGSVAGALAGAPEGTRVTAHHCDVSDVAAVERFRDEVVEQHATDHVDLVFNNAGIGGGGSFLTRPKEEWDRTFAVDWGGVYNCCRAFVPLLVASTDGYLVNTSSVHGFWASLGPGIPHTAYSAAKFAVKGFSEALIEDFRVNAPHVKVAVVMPGHVGTDIVINSRRAHGASEPEDMTGDELAEARELISARGFPTDGLGDDAVRAMIRAVGEGFRDTAPLTADQAAAIILDGVRKGDWRILVGDDAHALDEAVRADPLKAYSGQRLLIDVLGGPVGTGSPGDAAAS
jgi:NAD(P)-dependent dehydrogenase (short-subunit alcohol dehydrogenase family)